MPNDTTRIEIIIGRERRRRYSAEQKLRVVVEETTRPAVTVSTVARLHEGVGGAHQLEQGCRTDRRLLIEEYYTQIPFSRQ